MADNVELNLGSGGKTIATDDIGGVQHELVKVEFGGNGAATMVDAANPLPVTDAVSEAALTSLAAEDFATQATLAALLAKVIAAPSTEAKQDAIIALLTTIAAITQPLTDAQLRASAVPVTISGGGGGAVTIADGADITEGTITDAIVAAGATGTLSAKLRRISQGLEDLKTLITVLPLPTGAATAANQQTNALTDTQLRASPVPVSGTVTVDTSLLAKETKQDTGNTSLASILAKIIAAPATEAKQDTGNTSLASILAKIIAAPSTEAKQDTIITALATLLTISDFDTKTGSLTETAPATDTASSGVNGRLQRIAQRLTSLITALGSPFQAGGSIGNTTFAATQATAANLNMTEASAAAILAKLTAAAASFVKLEDVASADADAGVPLLAVRKATPANTSGSDGDYEFLQMSAGKLWVQAGATQKPSIGATVVLAVTALQSLASSATVGWGSVRVSNLATLATDYEIFVKLTTANTAPANDKAAYIWICPFYTTDAGSTWFASSQGTTTLPTGTDAASTIASPHNLRLLGVLNYTTQQMVLQDTFLLSNCFGNRLPDGFSIIITNFTGAALSTGCVVDYTPLNDILV